MKLEAAQRLIHALAEDQPMKSLSSLLAQQDLDFENPDDVGNSVVVQAELSKVLVALAMGKFIPVDQTEVEGGLYCWGRSVTMVRNDLRISVTSTSQFRTVLWLLKT